MAYTLIDEVSVSNLDNCGSLQRCDGDTATIGWGNLPTSLTYQWSIQSSMISGATNPQLTLGTVNSSDAGIYTLEISDGSNFYSVEFELIVVDCCDITADIEVPISENSSSYLIDALNGGSALVPNKTVLINGIFNVDESITFSTCTIYLGPNARVELEPGTFLTIDHDSYVQPCESYMYEGLVADGPSETININESTVISGNTAVQSVNKW